MLRASSSLPAVHPVGCSSQEGCQEQDQLLGCLVKGKSACSCPADLVKAFLKLCTFPWEKMGYQGGCISQTRKAEFGVLVSMEVLAEGGSRGFWGTALAARQNARLFKGHQSHPGNRHKHITS